MWRKRRAADMRDRQFSTDCLKEVDMKWGLFLVTDFGNSPGTWISLIRK